jgi:hypothetical protein
MKVFGAALGLTLEESDLRNNNQRTHESAGSDSGVSSAQTYAAYLPESTQGQHQKLSFIAFDEDFQQALSEYLMSNEIDKARAARAHITEMFPKFGIVNGHYLREQCSVGLTFWGLCLVQRRTEFTMMATSVKM